MLFLEGAISENPWGGTTFTRIKAPSHSDMVELVHTISYRIANYLEKVGLVERDIENSFLNLPIDDEDSLLQLQGASVSYRIAMGPQQGQKVFTLQTLPASNEGEYGQVANTSGFSLHAGVFANADEPDKIFWKDFEQPKVGPKGEGQDARNTNRKIMPLYQPPSD